MNRAWMWAAVAAAGLVISVGAARADVVNGTFSNGLSGWDVSPYGAASYVEAVESYGGVSSPMAHLHAHASYTWQDGEWTGDYAEAYIQQLFTLTLQPGETACALDAAVVKSYGVLPPEVTVMVLGPGGGFEKVTYANWHTYEFSLNEAAAGSTIAVVVNVWANKPSGEGEENETVFQSVDLYIDNIRLVPLPAPAVLLLAGAIVALRRRRVAVAA